MLTLITEIRKIRSEAVAKLRESGPSGVRCAKSMVTEVTQDELSAVNERLLRATPREVIEWAVERYFPRLTMATAFGAEGCVLIHLLAEIEPRVRVFNLDTGYQFAETLELRDRIARPIWD